MKKLLSEYWDKFIETDGNGNKKGNGIEFENLVEFLLNAMYGKEWVRTGGSHDDNRDFGYIYLTKAYGQNVKIMQIQ